MHAVAVTASEWKRAVSPVLDDPDQWAFRNKIAYRRPVDWVLLGVFGEGSGWKKDELYVYTLVLPLYLASDHLVLSYSRRVRPAGTVAVTDADAFRAVVTEAISALPTQDEALRRLATGQSEASSGARAVLDAASAMTGEVAQLRSVRDATLAALGIR